MNAVTVLRAVNRGLKRAQTEFNREVARAKGDAPDFKYGIIVCAMRMFQRGFSEYFKNLMDAHRYSPHKEIYALASLELARAAVKARDEYGLPVVGFDLAGEEAGYPADDHVEAFRFAHKHFLKKTVHAGEAYGPESIFQAITDLQSDRIGHGTYLLDPHMITDEEIEDREAYVEGLSQYIADRRITLEICLTSNLQTNPQMTSLGEHSFKKLRKARLSTTICTDNRTVSNTTVTNEIMLAVEHLELDHHDLKSIIIYGFKRSFMPGTYLEKRAYVRKVIDYYDSVQKAHLHQPEMAEE
jgi:adenosine deaminase